MISIFKLFIFLIFFLIICESAGLFFLKKINIDIDIIALPIGMTLFGCVYELLILPVQYFRLDSSLLKYGLLVTFIIMLFIGRKELLTISKQLSRRDIILFVLFIFVFIFKLLDFSIYSSCLEASDNEFYISLINSISMDGIAVNGPEAHIYLNQLNSGIYAYYGHMHFLSAISNLINIDSLLTINFFQEWYKIIFYITNIYNIYIVCIRNNLFKNINKYLILIFLCVPYLNFIDESELISVHTTTMLFIISPLIFYLKDHNKGWLVLFSLYAFHATSIRSTYIFLLSFYLLPYYLYLLISNRFEVKENVRIITPILFSLALFISYNKNIFILLSCILVLFFINVIIPLLVKQIGINNTKYLYILLLIGIFIFFIYNSFSLGTGDVIGRCDGVKIYDLLNIIFINFSSYQYAIRSIYHLSFLLFGIILFIINLKRNTQFSYCTIHILTIYILCFCPLSAPYVAKILINVYDRLPQMWINSLLYLLIFDEFIKLFCNTTIKNKIGIVLSIVLLLNFSIYYVFNYTNNVINNIKNYKTNKKEISLFYKLPNDVIEIGKSLEKYAFDNELKYVKIACPMDDARKMPFVGKRIRLSTLMVSKGASDSFLTTGYYTEQWNEDNYDYPIFFYLLEPYRFFDDWRLENAYEDIPDLEGIMRESNTDVFVIKKWSNREETCYHLQEYFETFSKLLYENDTYQAYAIIY